MDESKVWITTLLTGGQNDGFFVIARAASPWQSSEVIHVKSKKTGPKYFKAWAGDRMSLDWSVQLVHEARRSR